MSTLIFFGLCVLIPLTPYREQEKKQEIELINPIFTISSWTYPDNYGQGIDGLRFYENSTGSWAAHPYIGSDGNPYYFLNYYDIGYDLNWSAYNVMKIRVYSIMNTTITLAADAEDGKNYHKHNITVTTQHGEEVFSQQNFTYYDSDEFEDIIGYEYEIILNFVPVHGGLYTITITYELYFYPW